MTQVLLNRLLAKANSLFQDVGVGVVHEEQLAAALDLSLASFQNLFGSKAELVLQVVRYNLARQRQEHAELFTHLGTPIECLLALLHHSLQEMRRAPYYDYHALREICPQAWGVIQEYVQDYTFPLLVRLLQASITEGHLRADLDPPFIARIMVAQFSLITNEAYFPPDYTNLAEVYRNIYFYYVRGLCTEEGARLTSVHFSKADLFTT